MAVKKQQPIFKVPRGRAKDAPDLSIRLSAKQAKRLGQVLGASIASQRAIKRKSK